MSLHSQLETWKLTWASRSFQRKTKHTSYALEYVEVQSRIMVKLLHTALQSVSFMSDRIVNRSREIHAFPFNHSVLFHRAHMHRKLRQESNPAPARICDGKRSKEITAKWHCAHWPGAVRSMRRSCSMHTAQERSVPVHSPPLRRMFIPQCTRKWYKLWIIPSPIRKLEYRAPAIKLEYIIKIQIGVNNTFARDSVFIRVHSQASPHHIIYAIETSETSSWHNTCTALR